MTEAAMDAIPEAVREALEATGRRYGLYCRRSREAAEDALEIGRALLWIKKQIRHGLWMLALKAMKISYDAASRHMRLVRRGATVEMIQEHGVTGALMLLSQPRAPAPEKAAGDAGTEDGKFCSAARFVPPPGAPESVEAAAPPDAPEEPVPEDDDVAEPDPPLPGTEDDPERPDELALEGGAGDKPPREALLPEGYKHGRPDHRMVNAITWPGLVGVEPRVLALLTFRDGGKGAFVSNKLIAHHLGVSKARVKQCLRKLRKLGLVHSTERENEVSLHTVFPEGTPERRQRELTLLRTFDGGKQATPGREADSPGEGNLAQPGGEADFPQNRTLNRTGNSRGGWRHSGQARMAAIDEGIAEYWDEEDAG